MKRILLATIVLLLAGITVYAQQAGGGLPTSSQTKQTEQQYSSQSKSNSSQFETTFADLNARNVSNKDAETFNRLKNEIDRLEASITAEQTRIGNNLDAGKRMPPELFNRLQRLIERHKAKIAELDAFVSG